jgi:hypothetical protein
MEMKESTCKNPLSGFFNLEKKKRKWIGHQGLARLRWPIFKVQIYLLINSYE